MDEENKTPEQELDELKQDVKNEVKEAIDEYIEENKDDISKDEVSQNIDYNGRLTEIVDGSVPIYNSDLMSLSSVMEVYHHENELPPAFDGENTPINVTGTAIYEILMEVAWKTVETHLKELEEEGKFGEE